ncbi:MAG: pyridoxamine 5'-phosphate oxidase family protein [Pikeienuella sp.]
MPTAKKLNGTLRAFIERQPMFFVATAAPDGRVNVSPKGMDSLRVISDTRIRWVNVSGSGNETAAHVAATPRMTLMFCAFEGDALILRTYGTARTTHWHDHDWATASAPFPQMAGARQVFDLEIDLVQTSCGTGVPLMEFRAQRGPEELLPFYADMGADGVKDYWQRKNTLSIDGAPTGVFPEK